MRSAVKEAGDSGVKRERKKRGIESSYVVGEWRIGGGDSAWFS